MNQKILPPVLALTLLLTFSAWCFEDVATKDRDIILTRDMVATTPYPVLSNFDSYDDFPSIAQTTDGSIYAAYAAYYDAHDQIRIHKRMEDGSWGTRFYVPLVRSQPDIWMPQLAADAQNRLWVIWCEQTGQSKGVTGNWDLYARAFDGKAWEPIIRLTDDPKPDINPHVTTDGKGNIYVVWQAHPENNGDVQLCIFDGASWSKPIAITSDSESDWYPRAAVDSQGVVWIAFDSYRNGDYDVFLTNYDGQRVDELIPIATSNYYEAHASVACNKEGVWVAWEQGGYRWATDQGYWLRREKTETGESMGSTRTAHVALYRNGNLMATPPVEECLSTPGPYFTCMPSLLVDGEGRLLLHFRHRRQAAVTLKNVFKKTRKYFEERVTWMTPSGWAPATDIVGSGGRISVFNRMLAAKDGSIHLAFASDDRKGDNPHQPIHDNVAVASLPAPTGLAGIPELAAYTPPADPAGDYIPWKPERQEKNVEAIRAVRTDIDGVEHRIVRGDLHRHTELSWDVGPGNDGSYLDFYRYMIDVAGMDFGGITDHQGGGHYAYWWWLIEKSCDMYYMPPRFVPLYGYERSARFPNGHRNVFHDYRGVPVFPFNIQPDLKGEFPGVGAGDLVDNDTKLLYQYLHTTNGIAISHTSGTDSMGTDWRDNDPEIEPVVEIYQGARNSYEALRAPRVHDPFEGLPAPGGYQEAGLLWNAYAKGYRLGTTASSDHGSTHISYALVYTPENDRTAIIDSIRKRQTYGATDNGIVDFRINGHFMGQEFDTRENHVLDVNATGTAKIAKLSIVRNNEYIFRSAPGKKTIELTYADEKPVKGTNMYYIRLEQEDGELVWASPIWVNYK